MPLIMPDELVDDWIRPDSNPNVLVEKALTRMVSERTQRNG